MTVAAVIELMAFIMLTVVGERESPSLHVVFFVSFLLACGVHFSLLSYLTPNKEVKKSLNWRQMTQLYNNFSKNKAISKKKILDNSMTSLSIISTNIHLPLPTLKSQTTKFSTINYKNQRKLRLILTVVLFFLAFLITISFNINIFFCVQHCKFYLSLYLSLYKIMLYYKKISLKYCSIKKKKY